MINNRTPEAEEKSKQIVDHLVKSRKKEEESGKVLR